MLKSRFVLLENTLSKVNEQIIDLELNIDIKDSSSEFELISYNNKAKFIKKYVSCLNNKKCPVVINSGIPEETKQIIYEQIKNEHHHKDGNTLGQILCSSGTTSESGVPKSYFFEISKSIGNARAHYESFNTSCKQLNILFPLPLSHSFGIVVGLLGSFVTSSQTYLYEQMPSPVTLIKDTEKYNIDLLYLTPTMARMIIKHKKFIKLKGSGPRFISIGSSLLYKNEIDELMEIFKSSQIFFTYGLTEAGPRVTTLNCGRYGHVNELLEKSNNLPLGEPISGTELKYTDNLYIKSDYAFTNDYFDSEDQIEKSGKQVYLKGRADYVIISGGVNIYPDEIEAIVDKIKGVKRSCIVGVKSKLYGEVPVLCYVAMLEENKNSQELKDLINDTLVKKLPSTHIPHDIIELNNIATTSLGKVMRTKVEGIIKDQDDRKKS